MQPGQVLNGVPKKQVRMIIRFADFLKDADSERGQSDERMVALANHHFRPLKGVRVKLNGKKVLLHVQRDEEGAGKLEIVALRKAGFDLDTTDRLIGIWNNPHNRLEELKVVRHGGVLCIVLTICGNEYELC